MKITADTTFAQLLDMPQVADCKEFLLSNCYVPDMNMSLKQMQEQFDDWVAESIATGLSSFFSLMEQGVKTAHDFYSEQERAAEPDKQGTKLFYMPGKKGWPFVVVCPGGGYGAVCTLKEGFTTAARLNKLGYNAFILSYRVRKMGEGDGSGIMPKPLDDMAAAIRFIADNAEKFGVSMDNYAVAGFSSGGHLAGAWGTDNVGAASYGLPKPKAVFLGYPASDTTEYRAFNGRNFLLEGMLGKDYAPEDVVKYNVNANITESYPTTYVWHCKDDKVISIRTSYNMVEQLQRHQRPYIFKEVETGGHGFGLGEYSEADGWLEEAVELWKKNSESIV